MGEFIGKSWTKRELSLRPGPVQLACAVIEQWHKDGEPKSDLPAIEYWYGVINNFKEKEKCESNLTNSVNLNTIISK